MTSIVKTDLDRVPTKREWVMPFAAGVIISLLSLALSAYTNYNSNDKSTTNRVSSIETQQKNDGQRLDRMENKLDRILERLK